MVDKIYPVASTPGVQRDGTTFSANNYIDAQWCRWYRNLPKKMGGYKQITSGLPHLVRGMYVVPNTPNFDVYVGDQSTLRFLPLNSNGDAIGAFVNRTPAGFSANVDNVWMFDRMFSTTDDQAVLIAHAAPNLSQIDSAVRQPVWFGDLFSNTPLISTGIDVSGGIAVLHPFLFAFGDTGQVIWTQANTPNVILDEARVTGEKLIAMLATRGGNSSPAGLIWSLTTVIRVTQTGTTKIEFTFDTITDDSSILSSHSVVEYDGRYYWPGIDRFLIYTGIVQELPNSMSLEYFFSSLDFSQRQKVWGTKVTKWGEIWWHFPNKTLPGYNGECNDAVIYNIREKTWYDTQISRASGYIDPTFSFPVWSDTSIPSTLWMHERGVDQNINGNLTTIPSWFETSVISWLSVSPAGAITDIDRWVDLYRLEPDFKQIGDMILIVNGREYANSPVVSSSIFWPQWVPIHWSQLNIPSWRGWGEYVFDNTTLKIDLREQRRELTLRFVSAVVGGDYEMGKSLIVGRIGDARP
jgi:hypothetical protein